MKQLMSLFRGIAIVGIPAAVIGLVLDRFISSKVLAAMFFAVLLFLLYVVGERFEFKPWKRKR